MIAATVAIVMVFLVVIFFKPSDRHRVVQYRHHDENVCALRPIDKYGNELWYVAPGEEKGYSMTAITENINRLPWYRSSSKYGNIKSPMNCCDERFCIRMD